jgi:hypothetical protein
MKIKQLDILQNLLIIFVYGLFNCSLVLTLGRIANINMRGSLNGQLLKVLVVLFVVGLFNFLMSIRIYK